MLQLRELVTGYGRNEVLHGVDLDVGTDQVVALIGANGAGKSTILKVISGIHPAHSGRVSYEGRDITHARPHMRLRAGIVQAPEGRRIFSDLSVAENLRLGAYLFRDARVARDLERVTDLFPILREKYRSDAASLSGGQQQMLAIARAIMGRPRLLILDEPSLGLAPILVAEVMQAVRGIQAEGTAVLLVEQNANAALAIADYAYVLETGRVSAAGKASQLRQSPAIREAYLGVA